MQEVHRAFNISLHIVFGTEPILSTYQRPATSKL